MISCRRTLLQLLLALVAASVAFPEGAAARSSSGLARMERPFSPEASRSTPFALASADHGLSKRAVFDQSCKGVYDRSLFKKLDAVCDDCYNLYRKPYVATGCRENCFARDVFPICVESLGLDLDLYLAIRAMLQ